MNKIIRLKYFYLICLVLSYFLFFVSINFISIGKLTTIIQIFLFSVIFVVFIYSKEKIIKSDFLLFIIFSVLQIFGYINSSSTNFPNNSYWSGIIFIISYFIFVRFPLDLNVYDKKSYIEQLMKIIFYVAVISVVYAMLFQLSNDVFSFRNSSDFNIGNVYSSIWGHRNQFATVLLGGFLSSIYLWKNHFNKSIYKIFSMFFLINIIITLSRTVFVSIFAFFLGYLTCQWKKRKKLVIMLVSCAIAILLIYLSIPEVRNFADKYMIRSDSGLTGREFLWELALSFIDLPTIIFGRGSGVDKIILADDSVSAGVGFHNMYLTYIISVGLIILSIMLFSIISLIIKLKKIYAEKDNFLFSWTIGCIISMLCYGMFEASLFFSLYPASMMMTLFVFTIPSLLTGTQRNSDLLR